MPNSSTETDPSPETGFPPPGAPVAPASPFAPGGPPLGRRRALALLAGAGAATLAACGGRSNAGSDAATTSSTATTATTAGGATAADGTADTIPEETAGPYPGDGSNGPNLLTQEGVVRTDITSSFGSASGVAEGVPLAIELTILDSAEGGAPASAATVYVWHCDREGRYSMSSEGVTGENYLRGVQEADGDGRLAFTTIFPGAYAGRWPHMHFEVYPDLTEATSAGTPRVTSQIALPEDTCEQVYATDGYDQSVTNMARTSLASDNVFGDGADDQLATVSGSVDGGLVAALTVTL